MHLLFLILDVGVNQQRVGLTIYVLHSYLEAVEESGLWQCDIGRKVPAKVLVDYAIGRSKECKDMRHKVPFVEGQVVPVLKVRGQVNLLGNPE